MAGKIGTYALFTDGSSGCYAKGAAQSGCPSGNTAVTLSCWFNAGFLPVSGVGDLGPNFFGYGSTTPGEGAHFLWSYQQDTLGYAHYSAGVDATVVPPISLGVWHHVVGVWTGSERFVYLDGALVASNATGAPLTVPAVTDFIVAGNLGAFENTRRFVGAIDDVAVFHVALEASDVQFLWNGGVGRPASDLSKCPRPPFIRGSVADASVAEDLDAIHACVVLDERTGVRLLRFAGLPNDQHGGPPGDGRTVSFDMVAHCPETGLTRSFRLAARQDRRVWFVRPSDDGGHVPRALFSDQLVADGWDTATDQLRAAVAAARPGDEVWLLRGTYVFDAADATHADDVLVRLPPGVTLRGGFSGTEVSAEERIRAPRNRTRWISAETTTEDCAAAACARHRSLLVVDADSTEASPPRFPTLLDEMVFGPCAVRGSGAALTVRAPRTHLTVHRCTFTRCVASGDGGAAWMEVHRESVVQWSECQFVDNATLDGRGGALAVVGPADVVAVHGQQGNGLVSFRRCVWERNEAHTVGGAVDLCDVPRAELFGCRFESNSALEAGGALYAEQRLFHQDNVVQVHACYFRYNTIPTPLLLHAVQRTDILCSGEATGSYTVQASGGIPPYTYASPGASPTGLLAGNYTATVTDTRGSTAAVSLVLHEPPLLVVTEVLPRVVAPCPGQGVLAVVASGGTPPYVYAWSNVSQPLVVLGTAPQITGLSSGTYRVRVTDANACVQQLTLVLDVPDPLVVRAESSPTLVLSDSGPCDGSIAGVVVAGGTPPYTYAWTLPGSSPPFSANTLDIASLCTGTYRLVVTDSRQCPSVSIDVVVPFDEG